jgi:hypothetical protein
MFVTDLPDGTSTGPYQWAFYTMGIYMLLIAGLFVYQLARGRDTFLDGAVRLEDEDEVPTADLGVSPRDAGDGSVEMDVLRQESSGPGVDVNVHNDTPATDVHTTSSVLESGTLRIGSETEEDASPASASVTAAPASAQGFFERIGAKIAQAWKTGARNRGAFGGTGMVLVAEGALLLWLYIGTETSYGSLVSTYAADKGFMGEKSAALLASVYWGFFLIGRVIGVFASLQFKPRQLIIADLVGALFFTVLLFLGIETEFLLWACSGGLGMAMGSFYAAVMAWMDEVVEMSGQVISIVVVWVCISEALFPLGLALFMELNVNNFVYFALSMMAGCCAVFAAMSWYRNKHTVRK